ncbi:MAG: hypothetical protein ACOH1V_02290 [Stenotrophomonas sp.]
MTPTVADDMEVLVPASTAVTFRGEVVNLRPVPVGVIPPLVRVLRPMLDRARSLTSKGEDGNAPAAGLLDLDISIDLLMDLMDEHAQDLFEAVALLADRPTAWIEGGDLAEFIELAMGAIEVNRDFFTQRIAPLLAGRVKASLGAGPTPSSS